MLGIQGSAEARKLKPEARFYRLILASIRQKTQESTLAVAKS
jgi:hypothetical protein